MTRKKKRLTNVVHDGSDELVRATHGLVRDTATEMLKTIPSSQLLGRNVETMRVGLEVSYETDNGDRRRGVVLFIGKGDSQYSLDDTRSMFLLPLDVEGSEHECAAKLRSLENKEGNEEAAGSTTTATNPTMNGSGVLASTDSEGVGTTAVDETNKKHEDATTVKDVANTDGRASDENNKDDVTTNNKESNVAIVQKNSCSSNTMNVMSNGTVTLTIEKNIVRLVAEVQNSRPKISSNDGENDTAATNNNENERASRSSVSIGNQSSDVVCDSHTNTHTVIAELLREHQTPTRKSIIRTSAMLDRTNHLVDVPCAKATSTGNFAFRF